MSGRWPSRNRVPSRATTARVRARGVDLASHDRESPAAGRRLGFAAADRPEGPSRRPSTRSTGRGRAEAHPPRLHPIFQTPTAVHRLSRQRLLRACLERVVRRGFEEVVHGLTRLCGVRMPVYRDRVFSCGARDLTLLADDHQRAIAFTRKTTTLLLVRHSSLPALPHSMLCVRVLLRAARRTRRVHRAVRKRTTSTPATTSMLSPQPSRIVRPDRLRAAVCCSTRVGVASTSGWGTSGAVGAAAGSCLSVSSASLTPRVRRTLASASAVDVDDAHAAAQRQRAGAAWARRQRVASASAPARRPSESRMWRVAGLRQRCAVTPLWTLRGTIRRPR